jgi:uncharacterized protein DUF6624
MRFVLPGFRFAMSLAVVAAIISACSHDAKPRANAGRPAPTDTALARALIAHADTDQAIRDTMLQLLQTGRPLDAAFAARMSSVDSANTSWLKGVVDAHGWPVKSRVGEEASHDAWLIVQHAVQDTAFQARVLGLMEPVASKGEVSGMDVAMLADRLAVHRGHHQYYGTQAKLDGGRVILEPIDDSAHVDERRAKLGLQPLAEYVRLLDSMYTSQGATGPARP